MTAEPPLVIGFLCHWCAYEGADAAGRSRNEIPAGFRAVRVMCSGRVDPIMVLEAFQAGAEAVLILGCPEGDCHYHTGNLQARQRMGLIKSVLAAFGIDAERIRLEWVAAGDGSRLAAAVADAAAAVRRLGPLKRIDETGD